MNAAKLNARLLASLIGLIAFMSAPVSTALSAQPDNNCFASKLQCVGNCAAHARDLSQKEECVRSCQAEMEGCKVRFQAALKTNHWKKRCLALPDNERYFVDVVDLAWRRTSAMLRVHALLLNYVEGRLRAANSPPYAAPNSREISALISTLNTKNSEFMRYFDVPQKSDLADAADTIYRDLSNGESAFDVLSSAASSLVVKALLSTPDARSSILNDAKSVIASAEGLGKLVGYGTESSAARRAVIDRLQAFDQQIKGMQSEIEQLKPAFVMSERKELFEEVQMAQRLCDRS